MSYNKSLEVNPIYNSFLIIIAKKHKGKKRRTAPGETGRNISLISQSQIHQTQIRDQADGRAQRPRLVKKRGAGHLDKRHVG